MYCCLFLQQFYCNLGWDLLAADLNGDGFDDVIVGSPFAAASGEQRGFVAALFAQENLGKNPNIYWLKQWSEQVHYF